MISTKNSKCGYCHHEQHTPACPTHSSAQMAEYRKGFRAFDGLQPMRETLLRRHSPSFVLGYKNAEQLERNVIETVGDRLDGVLQPQLQ